MGHPYVDIIDNADFRTFNDKILQVIQVVCDRICIPYHDRFAKNSKYNFFLIYIKFFISILIRKLEYINFYIYIYIFVK